MPTKKELRAEVRQKLAEQNSRDRSARSGVIATKLFKRKDFLEARRVCFYVSTPTEVATEAMIDRALEMGKEILVPLTDLKNKTLLVYEIKDRKTDLVKGILDIMEPRIEKAKPADVSSVDCVIVPGLVFDETGNRIGQGVGLYDRFLKTVKPAASKLGLAFGFQMVPRIPVEDHDVPLTAVLTEFP